MLATQAKDAQNSWGPVETAFVSWVGVALAVLIPATLFLQGAFPIFTDVWLAIPLLAVTRSKVAARVGFRRISWKVFITTTAINLSGLLFVSILVEPWSHAYQALIRGAVASSHPDTTFAWLVRYEGLEAWTGLILYSGLVTIFGEEVFFRGWLLRLLQRRMSRNWAVGIQAALFTLPQLLASFSLTPGQGVIYAVVYSWLAIGVIGGWSAARTQSIWPSLVSAVIWNALMVAWVL